VDKLACTVVDWVVAHTVVELRVGGTAGIAAADTAVARKVASRAAHWGYLHIVIDRRADRDIAFRESVRSTFRLQELR